MAAAAIAVSVLPGPAARNGRSTTVQLKSGAGLSGVSDELRAAGVIRSRLAFMAAAEVTGAARRLKAGEYSFPSRASLYDVIAAIRAGRVIRHFITIPEGFTSAEAVAVLDRAGELSGKVSPPPEGSLLPNTYEVSVGESRAHVIARMQSAREALLSRLWPSRAPNLPYRRPGDAVILASIVEKETALPAERPHVAAVYVNRLESGMRLDSDPSVVYGLTGGASLGHGLRVSELQRKTPYNTYLVAGLPPTPIANPGAASLYAALHPAASKDLYFVANGKGGHVFSATLAEHLRNVARWRAIETAREDAVAPGKGTP